MARALKRLSARAVATLTAPGRFTDGGGLSLVIDVERGTGYRRKRWVFRYTFNGKRREMGLGGGDLVSLATARELAQRARDAVALGVDPLESRQAARHAARSARTFGDVARAYHADKLHEWRNEKVRARWLASLEQHAAPLMALPVETIEAADVLAVLRPIWTEKAETADKLRGRIEKVLDAAKAKGLRSGENPARWRGGLEHSLPKRQRLTRGHHPALPWRDLPAFMLELRTREATAAMALEFLILTAARTGEVLGARWGEVDRGAAVWIVPAKRMKAAREHRVPLSAAALAILDRLAPLGTDSERLVFPGQRPGRPLSGMSMEMLLRRMNRDAITVHGFRSSFRDWCGDATSFPRELAEHALAHAAGDATERAYRREQAVERRREMMEVWARFLSGEAGARVIELKRTVGNGGQSS